MKASIVDLRYRMKDVLAALDRGEPVTVSHRGRPRARLMPIAAGTKLLKTSDHPAFGLWRNRPEFSDVEAYIRRLRTPRPHDL